MNDKYYYYATNKALSYLNTMILICLCCIILFKLINYSGTQKMRRKTLHRNANKYACIITQQNFHIEISDSNMPSTKVSPATFANKSHIQSGRICLSGRATRYANRMREYSSPKKRRDDATRKPTTCWARNRSRKSDLFASEEGEIGLNRERQRQ